MRQRGGVYHAQFTHKGRQICRRLSTNLAVAEQMLTTLRYRAERGELDMLDNDFAVEDLKQCYLKTCRQTSKPGTVKRYEYNLQAILPAMPKRVSQITRALVVDYRARRLAAGTSPGTVNSDVSALSRLLEWGVDHKLIGSNPIKGTKKLPHDHPKEGRALELAEVDRLLEVSPQPWRNIWYTFLVTGMRKSELAELTFSDIDWDSRELKIRRGIAKNHQAREIPIDAELWDILCRQEDGRKDRQPGQGRTAAITKRLQERFSRNHVFVTTENTPVTHGSGLYYAFMRCCELAGIITRRIDVAGHEIDHVDLHSLRRTFCTDAIENGGDPKSVQKVLGHKTLAMTMDIYAKVRGNTTRQVIGRLSYGAGSRRCGEVVESSEAWQDRGKDSQPPIPLT